MSNFKIGDIVILNKIENKYGEDQSEGHGLPKKVTIVKEDDVYDFTVHDTFDGEFVTHVDAKNLSPVEPETPAIIKREQFTLVEPGMQLQYMTNTKKDRVSISVNGNLAGRIKFERIDQLIAMLLTLKEEV